MDESWRMRMGISGTADSRPETPVLEPEDFDDVYGGPPRSVLARKHSADFATNADWFYRDIFRKSEMSVETENSLGRKLPEFVIPARQREREGRTGRSNWSKSKGKCMLKPKSTSSSGWSLEDMEFNRNLAKGAQDHPQDVALFSFTSKLRPINVSGKWSSSSTTTTTTTTNNKKKELPLFGSLCPKGPYNKDNYYCENNNYGIPQWTNSSSLETFNVGPTTTTTPPPPPLGFSSLSIDEYDMFQQLESPSSAVSSSSSSRPKTIGFNDDHEIIYVNSWTPEVKVVNSEAVHDINEAIAWAKEKFQG